MARTVKKKLQKTNSLLYDYICYPQSAPILMREIVKWGFSSRKKIQNSIQKCEKSGMGICRSLRMLLNHWSIPDLAKAIWTVVTFLYVILSCTNELHLVYIVESYTDHQYSN